MPPGVGRASNGSTHLSRLLTLQYCYCNVLGMNQHMEQKAATLHEALTDMVAKADARPEQRRASVPARVDIEHIRALLATYPGEPAGLVVTDQAIEAAAREAFKMTYGTEPDGFWVDPDKRDAKYAWMKAQIQVALKAAVPFLQGSANQHQGLVVDYNGIAAVLRQRMQNSNFTGVKHEPVRTQVIDQWVEDFADAVMSLARPVAEVKAEALEEFADAELYDGDTDQPIAHHEDTYYLMHQRAGALRSGSQPGRP